MSQSGRRIMIDGTMVRRGGGFTYLMNIVPELARQASDDRFLLVVADPLVAAEVPRPENFEIVDTGELGLVGRLHFTYREAARHAARWKADLYFSCGEMAPRRMPCPSIASFRNPNVFALARRQDLPAHQRVRLRILNLLARISAASCDRILFVSRDTAKWMGDSVNLPESRRVVVYHGMDPRPWRTPGGARPFERPYILSVSSVYAYKNYVRLIQAYTEIAKRKPQIPDLVIVGDDQDPAYSALMVRAREAAGVHAESIHIVGEVPYAEIHRYYQHAELFVFASYLETFGHPLLEAMASGIPVVASDIGCFHEIAEDAALYIDPHDTPSLARAMERALDDPDLRAELIRKGQERVDLFSLARSGRDLLDLFDSVLSGSTGGSATQ